MNFPDAKLPAVLVCLVLLTGLLIPAAGQAKDRRAISHLRLTG
jgi:hypothetical protein